MIVPTAPTVSGGTELTVDLAVRLGKPYLHLAQNAGQDAATSALELLDFLRIHSARRLNVAGPRASQEPEIAAFVIAVLTEVFVIDSRP